MHSLTMLSKVLLMGLGILYLIISILLAFTCFRIIWHMPGASFYFFRLFKLWPQSIYAQPNNVFQVVLIAVWGTLYVFSSL